MKLPTALGVAAALAACGTSRTRSEPTAVAVETETVLAPALDPALLARGSYVAAIAGCVACHTAVDDHGRRMDAKLFAGGLEGKGEGGEGVWRSPNITPDPTTGIGAWSDDQLARAIRTGLAADGHRLLPIMPYPYFQRMSDADVMALVVFLRAQAPVDKRVPRSEGLAMPPEIVSLPGAVPDPASDPMSRGKYLANLMHCAACHTPDRGALANQPFAGGRAFDNPVAAGGGTLYAANITSDPRTGIGTWSVEDVMRAVRTMVRPDGTPLRGPMTMYQGGWSQLTDDDARALATYVLSIPPVENEIVHAQRQARLNRGGAARTSMP